MFTYKHKPYDICTHTHTHTHSAIRKYKDILHVHMGIPKRNIALQIFKICIYKWWSKWPWVFCYFHVPCRYEIKVFNCSTQWELQHSFRGKHSSIIKKKSVQERFYFQNPLEVIRRAHFVPWGILKTYEHAVHLLYFPADEWTGRYSERKINL